MEDDLARLRSDDLENEAVDGFEDSYDEEDDFTLCLVGRVLTDGSVHFPSLRNLLSELWHPLARITITELEDKRIYLDFIVK